MVDQRVSLITLGVAGLGRTRTFYERLGWQGQEAEETVFFQDNAAGQGHLQDALVTCAVGRPTTQIITVTS